MSVRTLAAKYFRDIVNIFTKPITMNTEGIRQALDDILGFVADITDTIEEAVQFIGDKFNSVYDEHIKPLFDSIATGLGELVGTFLEVWDGSIKPMLDNWSAAFSELWENHLKPMFDKFGDAIGAVADMLKVLWDNIIKPVVDWIIANVIENLLPTLNAVFETTIAVLGDIGDALGGVWDIIKGVAEFITGVFSGDWAKAWDGAKTIFGGFYDFFKGIIDTIIDLLSGLLNSVFEFIGGIGYSIKEGISDIISWGKGLLGIEDNSRPDNWTLDQAVASGRTWDGSAYNAMQNSGMNRDDLYGAFSDALNDTDGGDINLYIDGEEIATATDRARRYRNTRINPSLAY
jgi:phage-related protein